MMNTTIDEKIYQLFDEIKTRKADVAKLEKDIKKSWITNCSIMFNQGNPINIQTADESTIKQIVTKLLIDRHYSNQASDILELEKTTKFQGYDYDDWIDDCKKRLAKLSLSQKKSKLEALEKRLDAIVSPEIRRQMELDAIIKEIDQ